MENKVKQALEIKKALETLADYLDMTPQQIASQVSFLDDKKYKKLVEASKVWNKFQDSDIVTRGKMLGFEVTTTSNN